MNITELRVQLGAGGRDKLRGFASITLDECLVIRDLKIIEGEQGLFVAMPSRKLQHRCPGCGGKNVLRARHCNDCGGRLESGRAEPAGNGRARLYADIAHPIHQAGRDELQRRVLAAFQEELALSRRAGYVPQSFEDLDYHMV
jgi:stage V sporulation protein G